MKIFLKLLVLSIAISIVSGCGGSLIGKKFDAAYAQEIKAGQTTKDEIRQRLGPPKNISYTNKNETWMYMYVARPGYFKTMGRTFAGRPMDSETQVLHITFQGNIVKNFRFNQSQ